MGGSDTFRRVIAWFARRRNGVVERGQLLAAGVTPRAIEGMLKRRELRALFPGVYVVGPTTPRHALEMAAVLACGPNAVVSHHSAAYLYEILPYPARPGPIDITVRTRHRLSLEGIRCHRTSSLRHHETRDRHNIPVTAPIRTI